MNEVIGVDFDNTIINYDHLLERLALQHGLIDKSVRRGKKAIRDHIRLLPGGEIEWQKLQALMYGSEIDEAVLIDGVAEFFRECRQRRAPVFIVSHKTSFSNLQGKGVNFRKAAARWMKSHGFFQAEGLGLSERAVFFEATRPEKVARIEMLNCTHFVDDLEETFLEESFPRGVHKMLYNPHAEPVAVQGVQPVQNWSQIHACIFS